MAPVNADTARSSGLADDSQSLMDWRPVYETDGISVGIRTYRSPKGKLVEDNTGSEVELLWKVRDRVFIHQSQTLDEYFAPAFCRALRMVLSLHVGHFNVLLPAGRRKTCFSTLFRPTRDHEYGGVLRTMSSDTGTENRQVCEKCLHT